MPFNIGTIELFSVPTPTSTEHLSRLLDVWRSVGCLRVQLGNLQAFLSGQNLATCLSDRQPKQSLLDARNLIRSWYGFHLSKWQSSKAWFFWQNRHKLGWTFAEATSAQEFWSPLLCNWVAKGRCLWLGWFATRRCLRRSLRSESCLRCP